MGWPLRSLWPVSEALGARPVKQRNLAAVAKRLAHHATKGNVEAELASDEDAGCGCACPDYIGDDVVDRSNQIMTRLRATARRFPSLVRRLGELPVHLTALVGGERVGIIHGDPESLAGWRLALEAMEPGDPRVRRQVGWHGQPTTPAELLDWFDRAGVSVFAGTHTGLPYAQAVDEGRRSRLVINNGAARLSNFAGTTHGVLTGLSSDPEPAPTASTAPPWGRCAATRCRSTSTSNAGRSASWPSGRLTAPATARTSPAPLAAPTCTWTRRLRGGVRLTAGR